ncbi:hypothetical protein D3C80_2147760 [compost metagenome]
MGQTVGASVQFGITHGLALEHQRRRLPVFDDTLFELALHKDFTRINLSRVVEVIKNAQTLVGVQ